MTKKEDVPETAVVCQCGAFCYFAPDSDRIVCAKCGKEPEGVDLPKRVELN